MDLTEYSNIKIIVTSVDGVFTNGTKTYNSKGEVIYKTFIGRDFEALIKLSKHFEVVIISTCGEVSPAVFNKHGFGMYFTSNKKKKLSQLLRLKGRTPDECIYVGGEWDDLSCVRMIPTSFCPKNSCYEIKNIATLLPVIGGNGVIYNLYKVLTPEIILRYKFCE